MVQTQSHYLRVLREEFARRSDKNARYSLRSFARQLGMDAGALSQILSGKRVPAERAAKKLLERIDLSPDMRRKFLLSLAEAHLSQKSQRRSRFFRGLLKENQETPRPSPASRELNAELFRTISDWYHYAILELTLTEGFRSEPKWIAKQLGLTLSEARLAIARLKDLEMLAEQGKRLVKTTPPLDTADKALTSAAHRKRQKQILEKAISAIDEVPLDQRNHSAMTMAIDPAKIPEAKRRIQVFTQELCQFLESGSRERVYEMSVCLFPLEKER